MDQVLQVSFKQGLGFLFLKVSILLFWCWVRSLYKIMLWNKICSLDYWYWACCDQICIIIAYRCLDSLFELWAYGEVLDLFLIRLQSRPQWFFCRKVWSRSLRHQYGLYVVLSSRCRIIWFMVQFGSGRSVSWITMQTLRPLHYRNIACQLMVIQLNNYWNELRVFINVTWVLLGIGHWEYDIFVVTLYQFWSFQVLSDVWCWFYLDWELFYSMDMWLVVVLRSLVLCFYSLSLQEVMGLERFMLFTRCWGSRKSLLARDYSIIFFFHGLSKVFHWRFGRKLLWERAVIVKLIRGETLVGRRDYLIGDLENLGYHHIQFNKLKGAFLYIFK